MKNKRTEFKGFLIALFALIGIQSAIAQDALTSLKVNVENFKLSGDKKTISYDVYLQDVDATHAVAVPQFLFRMSVPQADLGTNEKTVFVTNASSELGVTSAMMTVSGSDWLMRFQSGKLVTAYGSSLLLSETFPGTRIGTFKIRNANGAAFASPQTFTAKYADGPTNPLLKTSVSVLFPGTSELAPNASTAQPESNFSGLQSYSLTATKISLSITDPTVTLSKVYDGTTTAAVTAGTLSGIEAENVGLVTLNTVATYNSAKVETDKTITVTYGLSGSASENYTAPADKTFTTGEITALPLTIADPSVTLSKVYDGSTTASVTAGTLSGVVLADALNVSVSSTATYIDANRGTTKKITVAYSLGGSAAGNYSAPVNKIYNTGEITALQLTIGDPTVTLVKVYDGSTSAAVTAGALSGVVLADQSGVNISSTAAYIDANVGKTKKITVTYSISGSASGNYTAPVDKIYNTGEISGLQLTISDPTITLSKGYDGTATASVITGTLSGVLATETSNVNASSSAAYDDESAGSNKTITVTYSLSGSAAANYIAPIDFSVTNGVIVARRQLSMKVYLQGVWNGSSMKKFKKWDDAIGNAVDNFSGTVVDTLSVELHDPVHYAVIYYRVHGLELNTDGSINSPGKSFIDIPGDYAGSYRLTIKHRNHFETTSALPVSFANTTINYDFTDASTKAFQSDGSFTPTILLDGKWMMYAGDVRSESSNSEINSDDLFYLFNHNSALLGLYGYLNADINGDGIVDEDDLYTCFANQYILLYIAP